MIKPGFYFLENSATRWGEKWVVYVETPSRGEAMDRWNRHVDRVTPSVYEGRLIPCTTEEILAQTPPEHLAVTKAWVESKWNSY